MEERICRQRQIFVFALPLRFFREFSDFFLIAILFFTVGVLVSTRFAAG